MEHLFDSRVPMKKDDPRRAKDFVRCSDPECEIHKLVAASNVCRRQLGHPEYRSIHCHPTF